MAALADLSDLINKATGGNSGTPDNLFFHKQARVAGAAATAPIAGRPASLWTYDGQPGAGVAPGAVAVASSATNGALKQANASGGREKFLYSAWATGLVAGTLVLYDRLLHQSNLSGTSTSAQTVQGTGTPTPALTRYTDGLGNIAWVEIYTIIGATGTTVTMSYTNQNGDTATSAAVAIGGTGFREVTRCVFLPLATGDRGIQSVRTMTLAGTTGTAGTLGVTVARPIAYIGIGAPGGGGWRDFSTGLPGIPEIQDDACLSLLWFPNTTTAPEIFGGLSMLES
jgi:hypothetical protein